MVPRSKRRFTRTPSPFRPGSSFLTLTLPGGREQAREQPRQGSTRFRAQSEAEPPPGDESLEGQVGFYNIVRGAYAMWYKRLERGNVRFPAPAQATGHVEIKAADLMMILDGVDLGSVRRQRRYSRESVEIPGEAPFRSPARL